MTGTPILREQNHMVPGISFPVSHTQPLVSLLLPNRNNEHVLDLVLQRLAEHTTYPHIQVVAVDDGSTDQSRQILRRWRDSERFPDFQLLEREHGGAIDALNAGLEVAGGEVIVQLDADASIETPGWVQRMLPLLLLDDRVGVLTAKVVLDTGRLHACGVNVIGEEGLHDRPSRITEGVGRRVWHSRVDRPVEGSRAEELGPAEVDSGIGCCMMYRRADALEAGGYDRGFSPVWFDDIDLCVAIRREGRKVFFTPEVRVVHHVTSRQAAREGLSDRLRRRSRSVISRAGAVSPAARAAVARRMGLNQPRPKHAERLRHHYGYWREKWGWDLLNPDMAEVTRRYADTEICWATDPQRKAAGEELTEAMGRLGQPTTEASR